ncbi:IclR family transcriptional regulator [Shinella sp. NM-101]|uniref:IclR family transcriptional regulator n=1 Tax=Shinella sp. NM-101 TaxID=2744455 RepID=UPI001F449303|nr:IclR family transcriptional regulator [Shinella sp. NM-101]
MTDVSEKGSSAPEKMLRVLDCFTLKEGQLTLSDISELTGMPRSTVHRWVSVLRSTGLLDQDCNGERYRLGVRLIHLGNSALASMDIARDARHVLEALSRSAGARSHLCIFDGNQMIFVTRTIGGRAGRFNSTTTMESSPCYCTSVGKAALAFQPEETIERIIQQGLKPYTVNTITDPERLRRDLRLTRERGYAVNNGEMELSERCIGAPVRNAAGRVIAGLSITDGHRKITDEKIPHYAQLVVRHADLLSIQLGYALRF